MFHFVRHHLEHNCVFKIASLRLQEWKLVLSTSNEVKQPSGSSHLDIWTLPKAASQAPNRHIMLIVHLCNMENACHASALTNTIGVQL